MAFSNPRGDMERDLNICLITFSTLFVSLRFYVRGIMTKTLGIDDGFALAAYVVLTALSSLEIREVSLGAGREESTIDPKNLKRFFKILPTMQLLYFSGTGLVRLTVVFFLPRLDRAKNFLRAVYTLAAAIAITTIVSFCILLFECKHVPDLWDKVKPNRRCLSSEHEAILMYTNASFGIVFDICLIALPIWVISKKMIFSATMVKVLGVFCVAFFVVITGVIRLAIIVHIDMSQNTTYRIIFASIWTDLEGQVGFWVACWPTLQPLLRTISFQLGLRSKINSSSNKPSKYHKGSNASASQDLYKSPTTSLPMAKMKRRGTTVDDDSSFEYDGDNVSAKGIVKESTRPVDEIRGISFEMAITKTTDVEVRTDVGEWNSREQDRSWDAV